MVAFGISLDGLQATHDSIRVRPGPGPSPWRQTVAAIERTSARAETIVITAVNRRNLAELPALCDHLIAMGVRRWQVQLVVPMGRVLESPVPLVIAPSDLEFLTAFLAEARATMAYWTTGSIYTNPFCLHRVRGACA